MMKILFSLLSLLAIATFSGCTTPSQEPASGKNVEVEESGDTPKTSAVYLPIPS